MISRSLVGVIAAGMSALVAPSAAEAQSGSVQIYGLVTGGVAYKTHQTIGAWDVSNHVLNSSNLGFRGTEDLGGGLRATFRLETALATDTGVAGSNSKFWSREATVGLAMGERLIATLGRQFHASTDRVTRSLDVFSVSGSSLHVTPLALFGVNKFASNDSRSDDTVKVRWNGPVGITTAVSVAADDGAGRSASFDLAQITSSYTVAVYGVQFKSPNVIAATGQRPMHEVIGGGGQYRLGNAALYLNVGRARTDATAAGRPQQVNTLITPGARYDLLPFVFKASFTLDRGQRINNVAGRDGKKKTFIAAVDYQLSRRTTATVSVFNNAFADGYRLDPVNIAGLNRDPNSASTTGYSVGIRHSF